MQTIVQLCMDVMAVTEAKQRPKSVCNRNKSHMDLQRHPICLTYSDHDYISDKIKHRDAIEYEKDRIFDYKEE